MVRRTLFKKEAITVGIMTAVMDFLQWGREIELNFESSMGKWEFLAKEQGKGDSGESDLTRLLLNTG